MATTKPDYTYKWASDGDKIAPSNAKIQTGWSPEIPPYQWENWIQNRQDEMLAHINERGIAEWDNKTDYIAGKSYVQGSDGNVYKSVTASGPTTTVQDPVTDSTDTYWTIAFTDVVLATQAEAEAGTDNSKYMSPLRVFQAINKKLVLATQAEAEAGTDNSKYMSPLRVFQALRSAAANATEALRGVLRVGTQAEVDAGELDDVAVTPKKMRWGFAASLTTNGYVLFPTWLGSLLVQWGVTGNINADSSITVNWPLAYTTACFCIQSIGINDNSSSSKDNVPQVVSYSINGMQLRANGVSGTTTAAPQIWFSLGV